MLSPLSRLCSFMLYKNPSRRMTKDATLLVHSI
jgi:hypothetical protein